MLSFLEARYDPILTGKNMVIIDDLYENCEIWDPNHSLEGGFDRKDLMVGVKIFI